MVVIINIYFIIKITFYKFLIISSIYIIINFNYHFQNIKLKKTMATNTVKLNDKWNSKNFINIIAYFFYSEHKCESLNWEFRLSTSGLLVQ
jgi:hypothetical protein